MKKLLLLGFLLLILPSCSAITINEIMYNPAGSDNNHEYIEIYLDTWTNLTDWVIEDGYSNDTLVMLQNSDSAYALIVEENFDYSNIDASIYSAGAAIGNNLNNGNDSIFLYSPDFTLMCDLVYDSSWGANGDGDSLQLANENWCAANPTPGFENDCTIIIDDVPEQTDEPKETNVKLEENTFDEKQDVVENKSATLRVAEPILTNVSFEIISEKQENFSNPVTGNVIWTAESIPNINIAMLVFISALVILVIALVLSHKR